LYLGHTRRLIARLLQVTIVLALATTVGCSDGSGPYAPAGSGGKGGTTGGICDGCNAGTSGGGGTGATGEAGTSGNGGAGGSVGGDGSGTGGSVGGAGGGGAVGGGLGGSIGGGPGGSIGGGAGGNAGTGAVTLQPWPSTDAVVAVDGSSQFSKNLSDLVYQPPANGTDDVLWGIQNDPSVLYCLLWNGTTWSGMTDDGWTNGKTLRYPDASGSPDAEGLTRAEWSSTAIYVAAERNNSDPMVSRLSVLRYDYTGAGTTLNATNEWNLTSDLPAAGANLGLEGIAWVPDAFLVGHGFFDEAANAAYDPSRYPNHGTGLFFVGLENNGVIYAFALDHVGGTFQRVATVPSGHISIMSIDFDRDQGNLWAYCDATCANHASVLRIGAAGRFELAHLYARPASLADSNNEGITMAPESECSAQGFKSFFWSDDSDYGGHAIYRGSIPCGPLP
jgi:hypothetical protein